MINEQILFILAIAISISLFYSFNNLVSRNICFLAICGFWLYLLKFHDFYLVRGINFTLPVFITFLVLAIFAVVSVLIWRNYFIGLVLIAITIPFRLPVYMGDYIVDLRKVFIFLIAITCLAVINKDHNFKKRTYQFIDMPVFIITLIAIVSSIYAKNLNDATNRLIYFFIPFYFLFFLVKNSNLSSAAIKRLLVVLVVSGTFLALFGFKDYLNFATRSEIPQIAFGWNPWKGQGEPSFALIRNGKSGRYTQKITAGDQPTDSSFYQQIEIQKNTKKILVLAWIKTANVNSARVKVLFYKKNKKTNKNIGKAVIGLARGTTEWKRYVKAVEVPKNTKYIRITCRLNEAKPGYGAAYFDNVRLKPLKIKNGNFENISLTFAGLQRYKSFFWDPNVLAKFTLFNILLLLYFGLTAKKFYLSLLSYAFSAVLLLPLILSASRSGVYSLFIGLIFLMSLAFFSRERKNIMYIAVNSLLILMLLVFVYSPPVIVKRLAMTNVDKARINLMTAGIRMVSVEPLSGYGLGSFSDVYDKFKAPGALPGLKESHNSPITISSEFGLLGLASFIWLAVFTVTSALKRLKKQNDEKLPLVFLSLSILAAFLVNSLFYAYFFEDPYNWLVIGLAFLSIGSMREESKDEI